MRLLPSLLFGMTVVLAADGVGAGPLIAGCCDSITSEPSYLDLIWDAYGWPAGPDPYDHNLGVDASSSNAGLTRLQSYLAGDDPDAVVVLSGTPDAFCDKPDGWCPSGYPGPYLDETETVNNVAAMADATLLDGAEPIVVAPPPVLEGCSGSGGLTCAEIDARLANLSVALDNLAFDNDLLFVDLYQLFYDHPDPVSLYKADRVHPDHADGDPYIADGLLPELAAIFCGNGTPDPGEECDDGNNLPGDGCSATCIIEVDCSDGVDNDGDGLIDFVGGDPGCDSADDLSERSPLILCDNGADDDGDGLIDFPADPGCVEPAADKENPRCNDGEDNDLDGLIDWDGGASAGVPPGRRTAPDPQCRAAWRDREGTDYCGLGAEMAFLLPALMWWRRRRRLG